jgi:hypothetical protein
LLSPINSINLWASGEKMAYYNLGEGFYWFLGRVVELDPIDEEKEMRYLGRVKVRVLHDQTGELGQKEGTYGISDDDLLWAWPLSSIQSASLSYRKIVELEEFEVPYWIDAVGTSPTGIAVGTYVFGFYLDGAEANIPVIFATYHKNSLFPEPPTHEDTGKMLQIDVPTEEEDYMDVSALAKGWWKDKKRVGENDGGITSAADYEDESSPEKGGQLLPKHPYTEGMFGIVKQPPSDYDTKYPYNLVHTTKSGHAIELDDTPGHERIHWWHRSGSYEEVSNGPPEQNRDGINKPYPDSMGPEKWEEQNDSHLKEKPKEKWSGRRVRKTTESEYNIVLGNKETLVGHSAKLEIANNTTTGISNNDFHTTGNNMFLAVGYIPRTTTDGEKVLTSRIARYQIEDLYQKDQIMDPKIIPEKQQANFITDVANNVQLHVGWGYTYARELDEHSQKNHYVEIANNQLTTIGWIPENNEEGNGESRQVQETEQTNHYLDIKNNSVTQIGWKPKDQARLLTEDDTNNYYLEIKNNGALSIGWEPVTHGRDIKDQSTDLTIDVKNSALLNIGYEPNGDNARKFDGSETNDFYVDVRNNYATTAQNNYYLNVGLNPNTQRDMQDKHERSLFIDVANEYSLVVGSNRKERSNSNYTHSIIGNALFDFHALATFNGRHEIVMNSPTGITLDTPSVSILGSLTVEKGGSMLVAATGSFTAMNGRTITVTNGIITDIGDPK